MQGAICGHCQTRPKSVANTIQDINAVAAPVLSLEYSVEPPPHRSTMIMASHGTPKAEETSLEFLSESMPFSFRVSTP